MRQTRKRYHSDEKHCIHVTQALSGTKQNNCSTDNALREKYKDILVLREPVICLRKCSENANWNCRSNKRQSTCKMDINNFTKDSLPVKQLKKYDPLLYNAKVVLTRLPKRVIEEATVIKSNHSKGKLNNDVVTSKPNNNLRKGTHDHTLSKRKSSASNKCINDLKPNLTETENEESMKTRQSKYSRRSNIISNDNIKSIDTGYELQANASKRKLKDNQYNSNKKQKLISDENDKCINKSISQGTTDQTVEVKEDSSYKNVSENNSNIDTVEDVQTDINKNKISNITSNNLLREDNNSKIETKDPVENVGCVVENKSNLLENASENNSYTDTVEDVQTDINKNKISNVTSNNLLREDNNSKIETKDPVENVSCVVENKSNLLQNVSENNSNIDTVEDVQTDINKNKISNITSNSLLREDNNSKIETKDPVENVGCVVENKSNLLENASENNSNIDTVEDVQTDINKNKISNITSNSLLREDNNSKIETKDPVENVGCVVENKSNLLENVSENNSNIDTVEDVQTDINKNKISNVTSNNLLREDNNSKIETKDPVENVSCVVENESNLLENVSENNSNIDTVEDVQTDINKNKISNVTSNNLLREDNNSKIETKDPVENVSCVVENESNMHYNTSENYARTLLRESITIKSSKSVSAITMKNTTSALSNINNCPKMNEPKEIKTDKIDKITYKRVQYPQKKKKRKKSEKNSLLKHSSITLKGGSSVETRNNTSNVAETNANGMLSQLIIPTVNKLKDLDLNENNENVTKKILKNEKDISVEQKKVETFGKVNNQECDLLQKTWNSEKTTETFKSPTQNNYSFLNKLNSSKSTSNEDEDDDCISLFADPSLIDECHTSFTPLKQNSLCNSTHTEKKSIMSNATDNKKTKKTKNKLHIPEITFWKESSEKSLEKNKRSTKKFNPLVTSRKNDSSCKSSHIKESYSMTKRVIDNFYEKTIDEFNNIYDTNNMENSKNTLNKNECSPIAKPTKLSTKLTTDWQNDYLFKNIFLGFCYQVIMFGRCNRQRCHFDHNHFLCVLTLHEKGECYFFQMIHELISKGYHTFLLDIYDKLINYSNDVIFILKLCKKLYECNILNNIMGSRTIVLLLTKVTMATIIDNLTTIVSNRDSEFINWILERIEVHVKYDTDTGGYWSVVKPLLLKAENINSKIINSILYECVTTGRHIQDVHKHIISKLDNDIYPKINKDFLVRFNNKLSELRKPEDIREMKNIALYQPVINIQSPESPSELDDTSIISESSPTITQKVWDNNNSVQSEKSSFVLHPIDDLPKPYSFHGRNKNWKFYIDVYSLQEGLKHNNYNHVMKILNRTKQKQKTFYTRACYKILKNEIHYSQYRLSKLNSNTVRTGATAICYEILFDVTTRILADLAEKEFWVLALRLLKDIHVMLQMHIRLNELDATTILLFAEIYLANRQPVKVFTLFKESNIIFTCRNKWKVRSNETDDYVRAQIMTLLLNTLCDISSKYAFFLFKFLMSDQSSNYFPVDLTYAANKLISTFLRENDYKMIINTVKLIYDYNLVLSKITYRAVIAALVHIDLTLAMQFYQTAVDLGIYSKLKFYPATYVIIKSNWTREEMYLTIFDLMKQLSLNIGHAIDHMNPNQLSVYLVFEGTPSKKQHVFDEEIQQCDNDINESKKIMQSVLQKFDPPISMIMTRKGKFQKLSSKKLFRHLQQREYYA